MFFPSRNILVDEVRPRLVKKTMVTYMQPKLVECLLATCIFDLWISKGVMTTLVHNFLFSK